jgi:hypothetical protein
LAITICWFVASCNKSSSTSFFKIKNVWTFIYPHLSTWRKLLHKLKAWAQSLELELGTVKCFFFYTHASKTQEFIHKMNVVLINLKANMGMNVSNILIMDEWFFHEWMASIILMEVPYDFLFIHTLDEWKNQGSIKIHKTLMAN